MNLFTLTDHDSIEGAEQLRQHPDFFVSEELTCKMPSGTEVHIGVYDLTDRQHVQLQQRRNDLVSLLMYLTERRLFFSINHVFSAVTGRREREDFAWFQEYFPAVETRNSHMLESANQRAAQLAKQWEKIAIGGSDAHALPSAGTAYTEVPGARDKEEFFEGLRAGIGRVAGDSASLSNPGPLCSRHSPHSSRSSPTGIITTNAFSAAAGPRKFSALPKRANILAGYRCRNPRRRDPYDRRQSCLEPDSIE
jgi:predicted metal-dependent phosphoesterase TrpH